MQTSLKPSCDGCFYTKECFEADPHATPYDCGMFGEWVICKRCNGTEELYDKNTKRHRFCTSCEDGYVKRK